MRQISNTKRAVVAFAAVTALMATATVAPAAVSTKSKAQALVGLFTVAPGTSSGATATGSYFRMVQTGGTAAAGPFVPNGDSSATDKTYTLLAPGTDGGLRTKRFQPAPAAPFDATGNGTASAITQPTKFFGVGFAVATNKTDPQTNTATKAPSLTSSKRGKLSGDLRAVGVAYSKLQFNQGSPKPDGSRPGATAGPTGTYNAKTGAYTLEWSSAIVGGPFNGFTGVWHLEGTFKAKK